MPFISPGKHIPKRAEMQITDVNNIRFRDEGYRTFQLVIQGCPANTEYPGRTGTIPASPLKRGKNQLLFLLLFRQDRHLILSHTQVQFQRLYGYPSPWQTRPRVGPYSSVPGYSPARRIVAMRRSPTSRSRGPPYGTLRKNVSGRIRRVEGCPPLHSESNGTRMVYSFSR